MFPNNKSLMTCHEAFIVWKHPIPIEIR